MPVQERTPVVVYWILLIIIKSLIKYEILLKILTSLSRLQTLSYNTEVRNHHEVRSKTYLRAMDSLFERLPVVAK